MNRHLENAACPQCLAPLTFQGGPTRLECSRRPEHYMRHLSPDSPAFPTAEERGAFVETSSARGQQTAMIKIDQPIKSYEVVDNNSPKQPEEPVPQTPMARPEVVEGRTYKLSRPGDSIYLTINRAPDGAPIEVFANSRQMDQALVAVTRLASSMLRAKIPASVVTEELAAIKDPEGGYFVPGGGGYVPSTMAHIARVLKKELVNAADEGGQQAPESKEEAEPHTGQPVGSQCPECKEYTVVTEGGCSKCANCGESECG